MPFLKSNKLHVQRFTDYTVKKTIINGYRPLVVQSANVQYTGEWKNGRKNGYGKQTLGRDFVYEGHFMNDKKNGFGVLRKRMTNGDFRRLYVGGWQNNKRHNEGQHYYSHGIYLGYWENNKRSGLGIMWYNEKNSVYMGEWLNDKYHGAGIYFDGETSRYEGFFKEGLKHGEGTFYHLETGQVQKGFWSEGTCVTSIMQDEFRNQQCFRPTPYPIIPDRLIEPDEIVRLTFRDQMDKLRSVFKKVRESLISS